MRPEEGSMWALYLTDEGTLVEVIGEENTPAVDFYSDRGREFCRARTISI